MAVIVLDPGHGGTSNVGGSGHNHATGPNGTKEKDVTLRIAVATAERLTQLGHTAILTRNSDVNLGLSARAQVAHNNNAKVFVSIHFNGDNNAATQGTETFIHPHPLNPDCRILGSSIQTRLVQVTGYRNRGLKTNDYGVLNPGVHLLTTASCLAEISFLTNAAEESRLQQASYKIQLAEALSRAITDFLSNSTSITPLNPTPGLPPGNNGDA